MNVLKKMFAGYTICIKMYNLLMKKALQTEWWLYRKAFRNIIPNKNVYIIWIFGSKFANINDDNVREKRELNQSLARRIFKNLLW